VNTPEKFGTVRLHSDEVDEAIKAAAAKLDAPLRFAGDSAYLVGRQAILIPIYPVDTVKELKLFERLMRDFSNLNFEAMAVRWCDFVGVVEAVSVPEVGPEVVYILM
jgi:hypothetical protein